MTDYDAVLAITNLPPTVCRLWQERPALRRRLAR